jgi:hypothetical protein
LALKGGVWVKNDVGKIRPQLKEEYEPIFISKGMKSNSSSGAMFIFFSGLSQGFPINVSV